ncbi:uncharacterized protein PV09_07166 [Verruconis gallopava]|uniref:Rhodopsin domain-containing protein n=1 Tax=Verruconis gallopava TaxID=253628 RepID=A0A0D2A4K7_9PEZI|nr:uncharacterized protein PV09_07166 [Verruconis gallopava]KIW01400.1 hypothetical protein PV09_07166 [Verruconis gallopava]
MAIAAASPMRNPEQWSMWRRSVFKFPPTDLSSYPPPNYINPQERGIELYIVNSTAFTITLVCASVRLYTRIWVRKYFGLDDMFLALALVGAVGVTTCIVLGSHLYYWNRHSWDIPLDSVEVSGKVLFAIKILWYFTSNCVRASILSLYYRLVNHLGLDKYRWVLHANSAFLLGLFLAQEATSVFGCWPVKALWAFPPIPEAKCSNLGATAMIVGILNSFSEAVLAVLPLPVIFSLNMSRRQRQAVAGILCGGFLVVAVGCVRLYYLWLMVTSGDPTWWSQPHWICSEFEMDVAIICACTPAILSLVKHNRASRASEASKVKPSHPTSETSIQSSSLRSIFVQTKAQALDSQLPADADQAMSIKSGPSAKRNVDIEGIKTSGFGYTVTITTSHGTRVRRRWDVQNRQWHYFPEEPVLDPEDSFQVSKSGTRTRLSKGSVRRKLPSSSLQAINATRAPLQVAAERGSEARESFQLGRFSEERSRRSSPKSRMSSKHGSIDVIPPMPDIPASHRSKTAIEDIRLGILPSPSSVAFEETDRPQTSHRASTSKSSTSILLPTPTDTLRPSLSAAQPLDSFQRWTSASRSQVGRGLDGGGLLSLRKSLDDQSSDDEFSLPLQQPSPRASGT